MPDETKREVAITPRLTEQQAVAIRSRARQQAGASSRVAETDLATAASCEAEGITGMAATKRRNAAASERSAALWAGIAIALDEAIKEART